MRSTLWLLLALAPAVSCTRRPAERAAVRVAAASDLALVFEELRGPFEQQSGLKLDFIFGSSGQLSRQIAEGAPYDLFASASRDFTTAPIAAGNCDGASVANYAEGRLVILSPKEPLHSIEELKDPRFVKIAIANPEHAPYGRAAKEALIGAGIWGDVEKRIVFAQSIQQAVQFASSGNAEAALVARSLAKDSLAVDPSLYSPLVQALVVCTRGKNAEGGRAFARYLISDEGQKLFLRAGFAPPQGHAR